MDWEIVYYVLAGLLVGFAAVAVISGWRGLRALEKEAELEAQNNPEDNTVFYEEEI
jgi:hypothetical protein